MVNNIDIKDKFKDVITKTEQEVCNLLETYGKCAIIRPTGFGKTYLFCKYMRRYKTLCIIPNNSIKIDMLNKYGDDLSEYILTYNYLLKLYKDKINIKDKYGDIELIIFDEMHRTGAESWNKGVYNLLNTYPHAKLLGGTATEFRLDGQVMTDKLFDGIKVFDYSLSDAFNDNILPTPYYIYTMYEYKSYFTELNQKVDKLKDEVKKKQLKSKIKSKEIEMANISNVDNIINSAIHTFRPDENIYKFIVFYTDKEALKYKREEVNSWFHNALPEYEFNSYTIISSPGKNKMYSELEDFITSTNDKSLHVIHCINMLTEGLHINDLTGIVMLRKTSSNIVFQQQIGRAINRHGKRPIVFDLVANIHNDYAIKSLMPANDLNLNPVKNITQYSVDKDQQLKAIDYSLPFKDFLNEIDTILNLIEVDFSKEDTELLINLYTKEFKSFVYLADYFNTTVYRVKTLLKCNGVDINTKRPRFPSYVENNVIEIYKNNPRKSITQIAKAVDLHVYDIQYILEKHNIPIVSRRNYGTTIADQQQESIIKMYTDDLLSITEIANKLNISCTSVRDILKNINIEIRDVKFDRKKIENEIIKLSKQGLPQNKISEITQRTPKYVRSIQKKYNIPTGSEGMKHYSDFEYLIPEMIEQRNKGLSYASIGEKYKLNPKTLKKWIDKYNSN